MESKLQYAAVVLASLAVCGCGEVGPAATGAPTAAAAGKTAKAAKQQTPAGLHVVSPETGADAKTAPGLYLDGQLLAAGVTDAKISPDGMLAVWQSGSSVQLYSLRSHKQRTIASNLPAPVAFVEWGNHYFKLKLANTGEFVVDNIE